MTESISEGVTEQAEVEYTPGRLAELIAAKHERLIGEYSSKVSGLERINVLKEKLDQLDYWIQNNDKHDYIEKKIQEKKRTEQELQELQKNVTDEDRRLYNTFKTKIKDHQQALQYWRNKMKEYPNG